LDRRLGGPQSRSGCRVEEKSSALVGDRTQFVLPIVRHYTTAAPSCYHVVQNILSFHLLTENIKIKIHKTITFPVVLYGSLISRGEHKFQGFENKELGRIFGP
jgi:hypothetical protein